LVSFIGFFHEYFGSAEVDKPASGGFFLLLIILLPLFLFEENMYF